MKSDRKRTFLFIIILLVLSMGIGYAFLTTTLTIDGVSDIDSSSWDIHFENVQVQSGSVTGDQVITPATISADGQTVSYHVKLKEPGEYYAFYVDAVNNGTLNAEIEDINIKINNGNISDLPNFLSYGFSYFSTPEGYPPMDVSVGDVLLSGDSKKMAFGIQYNPNIQEDDLPTENQSVVLSIEIIYSQNNGKYVYMAPTYVDFTLNKGQSLPNSLDLFDSSQEAINQNGNSYYVRFFSTEGRVGQYAIGFVYNNQDYYLIGADKGLYYERNKTLLLRIFGADNCAYNERGFYRCQFDGFNYDVYENGNIFVKDINEDYGCCFVMNESSNYRVRCGDFFY